MITARLIARGMFVQLVGRAVGLVLSIVTLALTVRYLGASDYGVLVTVIAFSGLFESFVDLGVGTLIVRRVTGGAGSLERLVGLNLGLSLIYALPLWLLATGAGMLVYSGRPQIQLGIAIVSVSLGFRAISTCFQPIYEVAIRFGALAFADLTSRVVGLVLVVVAIHVNAGVVVVTSIQVFPPLVALIFMLVVSRRRGRFRPVFALREAGALLRESLPLASVHLVAILYLRADGVLLSLLSSTEEVGSYGLAYRFAGNAAILASLFTGSAFSTMTRSWAQGRAAYNAVLSRSLQFMLLASAPLLVVGIMLGPDLVRLVASDEYTASAGRAMQLLCAATAVLYINMVLSQAMIAAHEQRFLVMAATLALVVNVCLNLRLVPSRGAEGAGIALVASEVLSTLVVGAWLHRASRFRIPWGFAGRLVPAVAVTVAALWVARDEPVLVRVVLLAVVYPVTVFVAGPVRWEELTLLLGRGRGTHAAPVIK